MSRAKQPFGFGASKSGGMRCPKCRTDMEQVEFDGVEIDRCKNCNGMWFDVGESDALKNIDAATAIDIGDMSGGQAVPDDEEGEEVVRQLGAMEDHRREDIYNICGNHDRWIEEDEMRDLEHATHADELGAASRTFLKELPVMVEFLLAR